MDGAHTLTVQPEVLGEGLGNDAFDILAGEKPRCVAVVFEGPGGEALVCRVEEREVPFAFEQGQQTLILFFVDVDAGWVVGRRVDKHHRAVGSCLQVLVHLLEVEHELAVLPEVCVVVPLGILTVDHTEDLVVVCPRVVGHVDACVGHGALYEDKAQVQGACARERVARSDIALGQHRVVLTQQQLARHLDEAGVALLRLVLLVIAVEVARDDLFCTLHRRQQPRLALVRLVRPDCQCQFVGTLVVAKLLV